MRLKYVDYFTWVLLTLYNSTTSYIVIDFISRITKQIHGQLRMR